MSRNGWGAASPGCVTVLDLLLETKHALVHRSHRQTRKCRLFSRIAAVAVGTLVAVLQGMALVTMWRRFGRECVIVVAGLRSYTVQLLDAATVVREQHVTSADDAVLLALQWGDQA